MKSRLLKVLALTMALNIINTLPVLDNIKDNIGIVQNVKAATLVKEYKDSQSISYLLYDDNTAVVKAGTSSTSGGVTSYTGANIYTSSTVIIPETISYNGNDYTVNSIGKYSFFGNANITSISLPSTITSIPERCFTNCSKLESINLNYIESIGALALMNTSKLSEVDLSKNLVTIGEQAFRNSGITSIVIPSSVVFTKSYEFTGCTKLTSVVIEDGITSLSNSMFDGCTNLTFVKIPHSVTTIGANIFRGCTNLNAVKANESVVNSTNALDYKVYLYDPTETFIVASYWVKSGTDFSDYANEIGTGWTKISGSIISNITSNSEFKCDTLVSSTPTLDNPILNISKENASNRENVTISLQ